MDAAPSLEHLLKRDGVIVIASLFVLWVLTWLYLATGAGLGMDVWDMTRLALSPQPVGTGVMSGMPGMKMPAAALAWSPEHWLLMVAMWWAMMIAMMSPSAAPTILLYARAHRHARSQGQLQATVLSTGAFVAGYFLVWLVFSVAASALQATLEHEGIMSTTWMGSQVRWLSGTALIVIGLYQLSPLKNTCLSHCRAPAAFLSQHWRPGHSGALRMGAMHGAYCVGCCWLLMALLFVGGVMNMAWIAALSLLVLAEKIFAVGRMVGYCAGWVIIAWGTIILLR